MRLLLLLIISVFASENKKTAENTEPYSLENTAQNEIFVKIEEDEYTKKRTSQYFGVSYYKKTETWHAQRRSKNEKKIASNGYYKDELTAARASDTLARKLIANNEKCHKLNFPDDDTEVYPEKTSIYVGVTYNKKCATWRAQRLSRNENKIIYNGTGYKDEAAAAHASDTVARKLIANGEKDHKLNFPDKKIEVCSKKKTSVYIGVSYFSRESKWRACRRSSKENIQFFNGNYKDEITAAYASDTLARKLIAIGEKRHKLNFPNDDTEVNPKKKINYFGVSYNKRDGKWFARRWSKHDKKHINNGTYKDEETAAYASDNLARKLIANGEKGHKHINFPDDDTEVCTKKGVQIQKNKRKRPADFNNSHKYGSSLDKFE